MGLNTQNVNLKMTAGFASQFPTDAIPQVALSGRSNVGKSSLINTLLGRKSLARVSSAPGKTITINFYEIDKKIFLVDLPGYGFAKRPKEDQIKWQMLTDGFFTKNPNLDRLAAVAQLVDSRIRLTDDDRAMVDYLRAAEIPYFIIATKVDKLNATERKNNLAAIAADPALDEDTVIIPFSSLKNEGREDVLRQIGMMTGVRMSK